MQRTSQINLRAYGVLSYLKTIYPKRITIDELNEIFPNDGPVTIDMAIESLVENYQIRVTGSERLLIIRQTSDTITEDDFRFEVYRVGGDTYTDDLLFAFILYWTEKEGKSNKMKFQTLKTFDIKKRLKRWSMNQIKFNGESGIKEKPMSPNDYEALFS